MNSNFQRVPFFMVTVFCIIFWGNCAQPHELKVTHPIKEGAEENVTVDVKHFHICKKVKIPIKEDSTAGIDITVDKNGIVFKHHKTYTKEELRLISKEISYWSSYSGQGELFVTSPPTTGINCHGLTFDKSKDKSWIEDPKPFLKNCKPVKAPTQKNPTLPIGTVVVYYTGKKIMHTGKVVKPPKGKKGLWIHSQWGKFGDFIHRLKSVPEVHGVPKLYYECP